MPPALNAGFGFLLILASQLGSWSWILLTIESVYGSVKIFRKYLCNGQKDGFECLGAGPKRVGRSVLSRLECIY